MTTGEDLPIESFATAYEADKLESLLNRTNKRSYYECMRGGTITKVYFDSERYYDDENRRKKSSMLTGQRSSHRWTPYWKS